MRIGICGTMSVGKSTLVNELSKLEQFKDYSLFTERSKYLRDLGIPLNNDSTIRGQFIFLAERSTELLSDNMIADRTIYDVSAFTLSSKTIQSWQDKRTFVDAARLLIDYYDLIIYVSPKGVEIEDNGIREIDPEYRDKIDFVIREMLAEYPPKKLVIVEGSNEERIQKIISYL